jgi:ankyrin repeat protein
MPASIRKPLDPLTAGAKKGDLKAVRALLDAGHEVDIRGPFGVTPLIVSARSATSEMVGLLLDRGADINAHDQSGRTALLSACWNGQVSTGVLLLERGAAMDVQDNAGRSALMVAALMGKEAGVELINHLLARRARTDLEDKKGFRAIHKAIQERHHEAMAAFFLAGVEDPDGVMPRGLCTRYDDVLKNSPECLAVLKSFRSRKAVQSVIDRVSFGHEKEFGHPHPQP